MSAHFSPCRTFRYSLHRTWDEGALPLVVIGLNPSTADETKDDPTIRKCMGYARAWGHGGLVMLNLFAYRATDPRDLTERCHRGLGVVGPENDGVISELTEGRRVLVAWGAEPVALARRATVTNLLRDLGAELVCLGRNKDGSPKHPLYLRGDLKPIPFGPSVLA